MQANLPFYEGPEDALRAAIQALGGAKRVGQLIWPDKSVDAAARLLLDCINTSRPEKLEITQIMRIFALAKESGFHAPFQWFAGEIGYDGHEGHGDQSSQRDDGTGAQDADLHQHCDGKTEHGGASMMQLAIDFSSRRLARRTDPATSHEAARRVSEFAGSQRMAILDALRKHGPMTPEQIGDLPGIEAYAVRKRQPELERAGLARPNGQIAQTRSGRHQRVWEAV